MLDTVWCTALFSIFRESVMAIFPRPFTTSSLLVPDGNQCGTQPAMYQEPTARQEPAVLIPAQFAAGLLGFEVKYERGPPFDVRVERS